MQLDLWSSSNEESSIYPICPGAVLLKHFAIPFEPEILLAIQAVQQQSPFRHLKTPGGLAMSVAMTNCGNLGWLSDQNGYRYTATDPLTQSAWPIMSDVFVQLATKAASKGGYHAFRPDACLINQYKPGAKLTLHQDKDELDLQAPIVSVSLGLPAVFLFGGLNREDSVKRITLEHGDVIVWGGPARLFFHGVMPIKPGQHFLLGEQRLNLTFRRVNR